MGTLLAKLVADNTAGDFETIDKLDGREAAQRLIGKLKNLASGNETGSLEIRSGTSLAKASGTFTLDTVIATDVLTINGVDLTCVASGASNDEFDVGANDTETAENIAAAINASTTALVSDHVEASSAAAVVTVTAKRFGAGGNAITISSVDSTITASGARLTGGSDDQVSTHTFG